MNLQEQHEHYQDLYYTNLGNLVIAFIIIIAILTIFLVYAIRENSK